MRKTMNSWEMLKMTEKQKPIKALNYEQCREMVYRCDSWEKIVIAEKWLMAANITIEQFDELMNWLAALSREIWRNPAR